MRLLTNYKANKAINTLLDQDRENPHEIKEAMKKIKNIGAPAIVNLIDALAETDSNPIIENLLVSFLNNQTLPQYIDGLSDPDRNVVMGVMRILCHTKTYDPNLLFEAIEDPDIPKNVLIQIILARKDAVRPKLVIELLNKADKNTRKMVLIILEHVADESVINDLIKLTSHKDPAIRRSIIQILASFHRNEVRDVLYRCLNDSHKTVRLATLESLGQLRVPLEIGPIIGCLRDGDLTIQNKAVETIGKINDPTVVKYLIEILQDDSEYVRRAAVEVLNKVSDQRAIKDLIGALQDKDWWVRVRAADALGSIGGPKIVEAVFSLISDKDEFLRRTAVEILNSTKDERAVIYLIKALDDSDWWVKERAADALAQLKDKRAIPALLKMLDGDSRTKQVAVEALDKISGKKSIKNMIESLPELNDSHKEAILRKLEDAKDEQMDVDRGNATTKLIDISERTATNYAGTPNQSGMSRLNEKIHTSTHQNTSSPTINSSEIIDPSALKSGYMLNNRYRVIKKVGEGAFGIVILVEDTMVKEEIILKFLNAHVASDKNMIERFVHELRYARKITHKNVIRIYDFLTIGGSSAISMEYFPSHSLADEIRHKKAKNHKRMIKIILDICTGISIAHRANVVHRDLKPANILIDDQDLVKLVDFGLAAAASHTDSRITKSGILVGTPTYMAPEQIRDKKIDARADIYSLGILMYEVFVGKPPYQAKSSIAILFQHIQGKAKPPRELNPKIPKVLEDVIMKAMQIVPEERYQTIDEMRSYLVQAAVQGIN